LTLGRFAIGIDPFSIDSTRPGSGTGIPLRLGGLGSAHADELETPLSPNGENGLVLKVETGDRIAKLEAHPARLSPGSGTPRGRDT
jgi:hypothetical protein